ncbi:MAG: phospholipid carrier-dependent glycosyltransferase [Chloroflexi bacterium]|nr:phospholipid carrier-dependent glycosyltransferase [Chloroflexota bacterium]
MTQKTFFRKYEKWIPLLLALLFILLTASGLATMNNPDELVHRVVKALEERWEFDETNFDYPSLPKYVMFGIGKVAYSFGYMDEEFKGIARFFSVLLGAGVIFLTYWIARKMSGSILASSFAALFLLTNQVFSINARFAHNDLYLVFFLALSFYFLLLYPEERRRGWLYAAFFSVGLAASSKYNGGAFVLVPLITFFFIEKKGLWQEKLKTLETLFIGASLTFLGFALGTPKALLWMAFYFKRVFPALSRHATYGKTPESIIGFLGQWGVLRSTLGLAFYLFFILSILYFIVKILRPKKKEDGQKMLWILLLAIIIFDLPIIASYNYQPRFFIPLMPFLAVLSGLFFDEIYAFILKSKFKRFHLLLPIIFGVIIFFAFLRVISVRLLLENDPRIAAAEFITTLPEGTKLEYTIYPPEIPTDHFDEEYSYPIFFTKFEGQEVPEVGRGKPYKAFNLGEEGLLKRDTDYLVIDSFTYARCANESIYQTNPVECDFFERLLAGEASYKLIGDFRYSLPKYLPQISLAFVNPDVQVFERSK